jgi:hypothetical protein
VPRKKKEPAFVDPTIPNTKSIALGPSEDFASHDPEAMDFNFVLVHRHYEPIVQKWGNLCSKIVSRIVTRDAYNMPIRWYHKAMFKFCYEQYDKYGDYYRLLDNSFGTLETDVMREVQ